MSAADFLQECTQPFINRDLNPAALNHAGFTRLSLELCQTAQLPVYLADGTRFVLTARIMEFNACLILHPSNAAADPQAGNEGLSVQLQLIDPLISEPYTLFLTAAGSWNGALREELAAWCRKTAAQLPLKPAAVHTFSGELIQPYFAKVKARFHSSPEFLWADFKGAVLRRGDSGKWFACVMEVQSRLFDKTRAGSACGMLPAVIVNLHLPPAEVAALKEKGPPFYPAYHMNKTHWISVELSAVSLDELIELTAASFKLAASGSAGKRPRS